MILVPRPAPHLPHTIGVLTQAGLKSLLPLALSHPAPCAITLPPDATAFILTSPLSVQQNLPSLPTFCVGEATANAARTAGLPIALTGHANAATLATEMATHLPPGQHIVHLHGDFADLHWHHILTTAGHTVTPVLDYQTNRITTLPPEILTFLPTVTHTLLFSAGSATHLAHLIKQSNLPLSGTAIALSSQVAQAALPYWSNVFIATAPTLGAMASLCPTNA